MGKYCKITIVLICILSLCSSCSSDDSDLNDNDRRTSVAPNIIEVAKGPDFISFRMNGKYKDASACRVECNETGVYKSSYESSTDADLMTFTGLEPNEKYSFNVDYGESTAKIRKGEIIDSKEFTCKTTDAVPSGRIRVKQVGYNYVEFEALLSDDTPYLYVHDKNNNNSFYYSKDDKNNVFGGYDLNTNVEIIVSGCNKNKEVCSTSRYIIPLNKWENENYLKYKYNVTCPTLAISSVELASYNVVHGSNFADLSFYDEDGRRLFFLEKCYFLEDIPSPSRWPEMEYVIDTMEASMITNNPIAYVNCYSESGSSNLGPAKGKGKLRYEGDTMLFDFKGIQLNVMKDFELHFKGKFQIKRR